MKERRKVQARETGSATGRVTGPSKGPHWRKPSGASGQCPVARPRGPSPGPGLSGTSVWTWTPRPLFALAPLQASRAPYPRPRPRPRLWGGLRAGPAPPLLLRAGPAAQPRATRATSAASPACPARPGSASPPGYATPGHGTASPGVPQGKPPGPSSLPGSRRCRSAPPTPSPPAPARLPTSPFAWSSGYPAHPPRPARPQPISGSHLAPPRLLPPYWIPRPLLLRSLKSPKFSDFPSGPAPTLKLPRRRSDPLCSPDPISALVPFLASLPHQLPPAL